MGSTYRSPSQASEGQTLPHSASLLLQVPFNPLIMNSDDGIAFQRLMKQQNWPEPWSWARNGRAMELVMTANFPGDPEPHPCSVLLCPLKAAQSPACLELTLKHRPKDCAPGPTTASFPCSLQSDRANSQSERDPFPLSMCKQSKNVLSLLRDAARLTL